MLRPRLDPIAATYKDRDQRQKSHRLIKIPHPNFQSNHNNAIDHSSPIAEARLGHHQNLRSDNNAEKQDRALSPDNSTTAGTPHGIVHQ